MNTRFLPVCVLLSSTIIYSTNLPHEQTEQLKALFKLKIKKKQLSHYKNSMLRKRKKYGNNGIHNYFYTIYSNRK